MDSEFSKVTFYSANGRAVPGSAIYSPAPNSPLAELGFSPLSSVRRRRAAAAGWWAGYRRGRRRRGAGVQLGERVRPPPPTACPCALPAQVNNGLSIGVNLAILLGITLGTRVLAFALLATLARLKRL